jgi:hypothetical protein
VILEGRRNRSNSVSQLLRLCGKTETLDLDRGEISGIKVTLFDCVEQIAVTIMTESELLWQERNAARVRSPFNLEL